MRVVYLGDRLSNLACHSFLMPAAAGTKALRPNFPLTALRADMSRSERSRSRASNSGHYGARVVSGFAAQRCRETPKRRAIRVVLSDGMSESRA